MTRGFALALLTLATAAGCGLAPAPSTGPAAGADNSTLAVSVSPGAEAMSRPDFRQIVRQAKDKVFPAVVFIKCIRESHESGRKISEEVSGSGVIISAKGEMVTNWHVVDKAVEIRCLLLDGRALNGTLVGSDKDTDVALVQLKPPADGKPVPYAVLGKSDPLTEGDFVMAIGAPWGMSRSVSIGIISCTRRYLPGHSEYSLWLQTDASISPGNSGGPLVSTSGEVVGINTRGVMYGGDIGFSIPAETVSRVVDQLRQHGSVKWGWTGLQLQPLRDFNRNIYFDATEGVIVAATDPESPAKRAGFQPRDRIVSINGQPVTAVTAEDLPAVHRLLGQLPLNQAARFESMRDAEAVVVELAPREKGKVEGEELACPRWDLTVKTINQFDNPDLYYYREKGVFIYGVKHPGNASNANLATNDIILKIDGKEVTTLADVQAAHKAALENVAAKPRIVFSILRGGLMRQVVLDFSRDYEKE